MPEEVKRPQRQYRFEYGVDETVSLPANQKRGKVVGLHVDESCSLLYKVRYVDDNNVIQEPWLPPVEIAAVDEAEAGEPAGAGKGETEDEVKA